MRFDEFGPIDTSEAAEKRYWELMRKKTPAEKLRMVIDRMEFTRNLRKATEHLRRPDESK
jgi:hypothetical protein